MYGCLATVFHNTADLVGLRTARYHCKKRYIMAASKQVMCSDVFAEPMRDDDAFLNDYITQLKELQQNGSLPDLNKEMTYKVYSIRGSSYGAHKSIVLTSDDKCFFTVELGFITVDGKKYIYPYTCPLSANAVKGKLKYLGTTKRKGLDLIAAAIGTMKKFGKYFKYCNNCQNYCNYYLEAIGLEKAKSMTDGDMATLVGIIGAIAILLIALLK